MAAVSLPGQGVGRSPAFVQDQGPGGTFFSGVMGTHGSMLWLCSGVSGQEHSVKSQELFFSGAVSRIPNPQKALDCD